MERLPTPLQLHSLQYCTASDLLRLLRCSRRQRCALLADKTAEQLLRRHFLLTRQQLTSVDAAPSITLQRLLTPLASLERQLRGQSLSALHRALTIRAICSSDLSTSELSRPHSLPVPRDPRCESTQWVQQSPEWYMWDDCGPPDSADLTLACIGLAHMQLWYHAPFWQRGWADYLRGWTTAAKQADTAATVAQRPQVAERDLICTKLDSRIRWIGCVQADPTTLLAVGYYYGRVMRRRHWVPATFGRGGYQMELAYSYSSESDCQRAMASGDCGLPVVTFDLSGSMETVNGHHLRLYDSLSVFLLSQAAEEGVAARQQVHTFLQQHAEAELLPCSAHADLADVADDASVTSAQLRGLPLYLSCFPISAHILSMWNTVS